jgi:hypothetical protein
MSMANPVQSQFHVGDVNVPQPIHFIDHIEGDITPSPYDVFHYGKAGGAIF